MSYKTIIVHVDDSVHAAERIRISAVLAVAIVESMTVPVLVSYRPASKT